LLYVVFVLNIDGANVEQIWIFWKHILVQNVSINWSQMN